MIWSGFGFGLVWFGYGLVLGLAPIFVLLGVGFILFDFDCFGSGLILVLVRFWFDFFSFLWLVWAFGFWFGLV